MADWKTSFVLIWWLVLSMLVIDNLGNVEWYHYYFSLIVLDENDRSCAIPRAHQWNPTNPLGRYPEALWSQAQSVVMSLKSGCEIRIRAAWNHQNKVLVRFSPQLMKLSAHAFFSETFLSALFCTVFQNCGGTETNHGGLFLPLSPPRLSLSRLSLFSPDLLYPFYFPLHLKARFPATAIFSTFFDLINIV